MKLERLSRIATALALCVLASSASAQDVLKLKAGEVLRGYAHGYDEAAQTVKFRLQDGTERTLRIGDLDRLSAYKIGKSRAKKDDADDQIKMGNFARSIEYFAYAAKHYDAAEKADPSRREDVAAERARNRSEAAAYCMRNADAAQRKGNTAEAERWLTTLVEKLPNEPLAEQAAARLAEAYATTHAALDDAYERDYAELLAGDLQTGKRAYDSMLADIEKGLANTKKSSQAKKAFESAFRSGEKALKEIGKVRKKAGSEDAGLLATLDGYRALVVEHMVASSSHLASMYTGETNYKNALAAVNQALGVDPGNRDLLAQRARIEQAASEGLRIRW